MADPDVSARMREDWNSRAREDAGYYVAFGRRDQDDAGFLATATEVVNNLEKELRRVPRTGRGGQLNLGRALEIGCGPGRLMRPMSRHFGEVHGVDVSDEMIAIAREKLSDIPHAIPQVCDGSHLTAFADDSFDFVYSYAVFQHIPSRDVVLEYFREIQRVLKPGGLTRLQINGLPRGGYDDAYDTWSGARFSAVEILEFCQQYNLQVLALEGALTQYMWTTWRKQAPGWSIAQFDRSFAANHQANEAAIPSAASEVNDSQASEANVTQASEANVTQASEANVTQASEANVTRDEYEPDPTAAPFQPAPSGPSIRIRRITNAQSSEPIAPCRGRFASISIWVEQLPADAGLGHIRVSIGDAWGTPIYLGPADNVGMQQITVVLPDLESTGLLPVKLFWLDQPLAAPAALRVIPPGPSVPTLCSVTDGVNLVAGSRIETRHVKMTLEEIAQPEELNALIAGQPVVNLEYFCVDPKPQKYEFNFQLPEDLVPGDYPLEVSVGRRKLAPVMLEVAN